MLKSFSSIQLGTIGIHFAQNPNLRIKTEARNYKPIYILPFISKVIEKSIHYQIQDYLQKDGFLYIYQSGFKANRSTNTCLSQLTDTILNGADNEKHTDVTLIGLQKVLNALNHEVHRFSK